MPGEGLPLVHDPVDCLPNVYVVERVGQIHGQVPRAVSGLDLEEILEILVLGVLRATSGGMPAISASTEPFMIG